MSPEEFAKHVGASTFEEAVDVTLRTKAQDEDKIEEMYNRIKSLGSELESLRKENEGRRVLCIHAREMIELLADRRTPNQTKYFALIQSLTVAEKE